eukprot:3699671-Amphidinium_carterae.1
MSQQESVYLSLSCRVSIPWPLLCKLKCVWQAKSETNHSKHRMLRARANMRMPQAHESRALKFANHQRAPVSYTHLRAHETEADL